MDKIDILMRDLIHSFDYEPLNDMFSRLQSGKKLRSKLILKIAKESENSLKLCAIIELIQAASLLHDDVIDESDTRRGKPSINATEGSKNAVMLGDILYSKAYFELSSFDKFISSEVSKAVSILSIGELMDVRMSESFNEDREKYLKMLEYKTAVLIEASAKCGAFLAGLDSDKFGSYGRNLGIAFQIIDDILDITTPPEILGKPAMHDFKEGKTTLPYIYLHQKLDQNGKEKLKSLFKKELQNDEIKWLRDEFKKHNIIEICIDEAKDYANKALNSVKEFDNSELNEIVNSMIDRKF